MFSSAFYVFVPISGHGCVLVAQSSTEGRYSWVFAYCTSNILFTSFWFFSNHFLWPLSFTHQSWSAHFAFTFVHSAQTLPQFSTVEFWMTLITCLSLALVVEVRTSGYLQQMNIVYFSSTLYQDSRHRPKFISVSTELLNINLRCTMPLNFYSSA